MSRNPSGSAASAASRAVSSVTSKAAGYSLFAPSEAPTASSRSARRPVAITRQPAATNARAAASPMPEVAPVMRAVLVMMSSAHSTNARSHRTDEGALQENSCRAVAPLIRDLSHTISICYLSDAEDPSSAAMDDRKRRPTHCKDWVAAGNAHPLRRQDETEVGTESDSQMSPQPIGMA